MRQLGEGPLEKHKKTEMSFSLKVRINVTVGHRSSRQLRATGNALGDGGQRKC